jgi:ribosome-associated translation inhibitor RaiA
MAVPIPGSCILNLSGFRSVEEHLKGRLETEIQRTMNRLSKVIPLEELSIHMRLYEQGGRKTKYSLKAKLATEKGLFFSSSHGWDLSVALKDLLERLEREAMENRHKKQELRKSA